MFTLICDIHFLSILLHKKIKGNKQRIYKDKSYIVNKYKKYQKTDFRLFNLKFENLFFFQFKKNNCHFF